MNNFSYKEWQNKIEILRKKAYEDFIKHLNKASRKELLRITKVFVNNISDTCGSSQNYYFDDKGNYYNVNLENKAYGITNDRFLMKLTNGVVILNEDDEIEYINKNLECKTSDIKNLKLHN